MWLRAAIVGLLLITQASTQAVFAHFMLENVKSWSESDWAVEIEFAKSAHLDAFALNMRSDDSSVDRSLKNAFSAASCTGFKLFFSFDYAGGGPWSRDRVQALIKQYQSNSSYFHYQNRPLVSTFEGSQNASDWASIKEATNCFFIPDWSSIGPKAALDLGVADGLFSWNAWPNGPNDMATGDDVYYQEVLGNDRLRMPYMIPVSPWFFTNLPGYEKNWLWRGDDLWYDRWQQVLALKPDFVQIVTWNDYGESHYIGPLHDEGYDAFTIGKAPFNYAKDMPHDGWRDFLPSLVEMYKTGNPAVAREGVQAWYRLAPKDGCPDGGTTGNVASHGQTVFKAADIVQDKIFFSALLRSPANVTVTVGGFNTNASWRNIPDNGTGLYHGNVPYNQSTGDVVIALTRNDSTVLTLNGKAITMACPNGIQNWNAWVGSQMEDCPSCTQEASNSTCMTSPGTSLQFLTLVQYCLWVVTVSACLL